MTVIAGAAVPFCDVVEQLDLDFVSWKHYWLNLVAEVVHPAIHESVPFWS